MLFLVVVYDFIVEIDRNVCNLFYYYRLFLIFYYYFFKSLNGYIYSYVYIYVNFLFLKVDLLG